MFSKHENKKIIHDAFFLNISIGCFVLFFYPKVKLPFFIKRYGRAVRNLKRGVKCYTDLLHSFQDQAGLFPLFFSGCLPRICGKF